ncbi:DUF262 domain-containing HNH endonuclease family protein [Vibrio pelagius]|uniref:DUF262 domain-containing HNH endonuclease family protein n=1 Tax=Vibrio pelagius TaxID=28169 RepID=A0ABY5G7K5_VIBPE|nr:DUF262 domain-containing protein [Vibrio pelagius]UTT85440.1 DUF262 domain-containing HNH endonuclease family protein [Vibrio pelagius]
MNSFKDTVASKFFFIPLNQRGYSWGKNNIKDMLSDLKIADKKSHYMGTIIFTRDKSGDIHCDDYQPANKSILEDGQQRITSVFILLSALRNRLCELGYEENKQYIQDIESVLFYKKDGNKIRLQNENLELNACLEYIISGKGIKPESDSLPKKAMLDAAEYAKTRFSELELDECLMWKTRLTMQAQFVMVDLEDKNLDRYLTFDAINSRGLPLGEFDKIKNFAILIDQTCGLALSPEKCWFEAIKELNKYGVSSRAFEESYITELFNIHHDLKVSQGVVHQSFVEKYRPLLDGEPSKALINDFIGFINTWVNYAKGFGVISTKNKDKIKSIVSYGAFKSLTRIDNLDLVTIMRPLLAICFSNMDENDFEDVAETCEKYIFRVHCVINKRKDFNSKNIISLANSVLKNSKDKSYVLKNLYLDITETAPIEDVVKKLSNGEVKYNYDPRVSGWLYLYYFLYEYELYLSPQGVSPLPWATSKTEKINTIEHILPQQHRDGGFWEAHWASVHLADNFKHRLGNLVLTPENAKLGRKPISEKIKSDGYCYTSNNATNAEKQILEYATCDGKEWVKDNIIKREFDLLKFAAERWAIPSVKDKITVYLTEEFKQSGLPEIKTIINDAFDEDLEEEFEN